MRAYPIKFNPILKEKIWGGEKLKTVLNKQTEFTSIGESWEISDVDENVSVVTNGLYKGYSLKQLINNWGAEFLGTKNTERFGNKFPLLIKYIDAAQDLSIQVHPDDAMAINKHNSFGKTEMWYIMHKEKDAEIIVGLNAEEKTTMLDKINANNVNEIFNREKVNVGDSYFIPAGQVHAIGAGVMVAEIQQTSDITYRIYDWDRKDKQGNARQLHTKQALEASKHFSKIYKKEVNTINGEKQNLANCQYFTTNLININANFIKDYSNLDSFVIFMCVEGSICINVNGWMEKMNKGETLLIPANTDNVTFSGSNAKLLEVYVAPVISSEYILAA